MRPPPDAAALPERMPVFPLAGALVLPRAELRLNVFEPRYVTMVDDALASSRIIVMVQPRIGADGPDRSEPPGLSDVGGAGRITAFRETPDGRYLVTLTGICRVRLVEELEVASPYRVCRVSGEPFGQDFSIDAGRAVDRARLVETMRAFVAAHGFETDWETIERAPTELLVNALSILSPCAPREKQALLEARDIAARAELLIAITRMSLAEGNGGAGPTLQ